MIIPTHVHIETVFNMCTARCTMCIINSTTKKPNIMSNEDFIHILNKFRPYQENIKFVSLIGLGETLLDKDVVEKVKIAKDMGFKGVGFPTNCTELDEQMSTSLIMAGLDTLICSIDGYTKKTHELIRVGTNFADVTTNAKRFIDIRNKLNKIDNKLRTKVLLRFIYQNDNKHEWNKYYEYWLPFLNKEFGDDVIKFNIHNWGNKLKDYKSVNDNSITHDNYICKDIYNRFIILSNGNVILCCGDSNEFYNLGNVLHDDPIEIYNCEIYNKYRSFMKDGKIQDLELCKNCTTQQSRLQL
ncbi:radical SAM protein [Patescibacteria group bacterium]|nr:radical SAM protein [Patescibacteria group bacterium]